MAVYCWEKQMCIPIAHVLTISLDQKIYDAICHWVIEWFDFIPEFISTDFDQKLIKSVKNVF